MTPRPNRSRWTSFEADASAARPRSLHESRNPRHRLRVEHTRNTILIHLSDEGDGGWTVFAVDRAGREHAAAHGLVQRDTAAQAFERLYGEG